MMSPMGRVWDGCSQFDKRFERELKVRNHMGDSRCSSAYFPGEKLGE